MSHREISPHESRFYHQLSSLYEPVFSQFFRDRALRAIGDLNIEPGAEVLEVGVGTGLSLEAYPHHARVTGCDLSEEMLRHARAKVEAESWEHIRLLQMDGQTLEFPDESFDYVMAFHVITVVTEPRKLMDELVRVTKTGGTIMIINHFRSHRAWLAKLVASLDPVTRHLGWQTTLGLDDVISEKPVQVADRYKTAHRSLFNVVVLKKTGQSAVQEIPPPSIRRSTRPVSRRRRLKAKV